jgi:hypothetical protein
MITVLVGNRETAVAGATGAGDELWLPAAQVPAATGCEVKPEGFCRGETCVPVPRGRESDFLRDGRVHVSAFWRRLGHPALHDDAGSVWVLGESAAARSAQLASLEAPDFALPDLSGRVHRLSDYRGRRVLLVTWASW